MVNKLVREERSGGQSRCQSIRLSSVSEAPSGVINVMGDTFSVHLPLETSTGVMDAANSDLLSKNLDRIINFFSKGHVTTTLAKLNEFKTERAKHS